MSDTIYASADAVHGFAVRLLRAFDVPAGDAEIVARCLTRADLRGVDTHGVARLPGYCARIRSGLLNIRPNLEVRQVTPVAAAIDGQEAFGFVVSTRAMDAAIEMARTYGIGIVSAKRSTHFGMAANYVLQAIEQGLAGIVFTNSAPAMPPWGGRTALMGTSPMAAGTPGGFLLDMSPTVVARGKIRKAGRRGLKMPEGWALDAEGRSTTDPAAALDGGTLLPIGGHKGSALAVMMDVFSGVLSGSAFAGRVGDQYLDFDRPQNVGHFFLAMKPDLFVSMDEFQSRMATLCEAIHGAPRAAGSDEVLMPGDPEARHEATRRREGIPYLPADIAEVLKTAKEAGVAPLETSPKPLA